MGKEEYAALRNRILKLDEVKGIEYPQEDTGFPEKRFRVKMKVSKVGGKKVTEEIPDQLFLKIFVCKDVPEVHKRIIDIIGDIPYQVAVLFKH